MNEENAKKIWAYIQESGDKLVGKLPSSRNHPKGRNPYAHVAICVKNTFCLLYTSPSPRVRTRSRMPSSA